MITSVLSRQLDVIDDLTRRTFIGGSVSLAALLTACGSESNPAPSTGANTDRPGFPVSIDHQFGSTTVPRAPERVISVGLTDQDVLLALGIKPVAVTSWFGLEPAETGPWALPQQFASVNMPWQEETTLIGRAVGQGPKAAELVADVEERFTMAQARYPQFAGATAVPAYYGGDQYGFYGPEEARGRLLNSLGFIVPPAAAGLVKPGEPLVEVSNEQLSLLDGDLVLWFAYDEDNRKQIENDPVYQQLSIAREGRVVFLGTGEQETLAAAIGFSTVLSLPYALDRLLPLLAAAIDGNPATR